MAAKFTPLIIENLGGLKRKRAAKVTPTRQSRDIGVTPARL
ncbi:hypothetical protein ACFSUK_35610 [Sphingobium scionense]|uniref:Uncharacterized protein n=1 Tax=Sphingobium scionense TaxID=1404341 RepID=A0A7W6PTC6_9SPHN|nr:hypothetical protein [Sphingobium scionense]MBB4147205.1 hypothetical protein [Sphingobium scionense]